MSPPPGPPPPAPTSQELMHPPIAALVSQRREAMVRTNPQLRHQPPPGQLHHQQHQQDRQAFGHYHRPTRMLQPTRSQQQPSSYRQYPPQMPRYHSEESLPSKAGTQGSGLYSSRFVYIFIIGAGAVCFHRVFFRVKFDGYNFFQNSFVGRRNLISQS